ncbi:hypothetical protein [uncultured Shimia sp.]|uniref:hypothetical protein n=1 Tax=uncultured Shimia sp. TaxID=573152 RepID=UPI00261DE721|nr:hypothetical protein [uncultured Shimia sp.]
MRFFRRSIPFAIAAALACAAQTASAENASNPLAAVNNTDFRYQFYDLGGGFDQQDAIIDGAYMLRPNLKFKYEAHYYSTDVSGTRENELSRINLKGIYFPSEKKLNETWGVRTAVGLEWILDFGDPAKGTGLGSDQIAPFGGLAFANLNTGLTLIPLIQHYESYNGPTDVSQTAIRLIALQPFGEVYWAKLDLKLPYDWTNDVWPASAEVQLGKNLNDKIAIYGDLFVGLGRDRLYDYGIGVGLRFKY